MHLILGLGNPGREYEGTRHNVGWEVLDALAERVGWAPVGDFNRLSRTRFEAMTFEGVADLPNGSTEKLLLVKPITFMNLSGRSLKQAVGFYKVPPEKVLVVVDELALPAGKLRLRGDGSDGGHNGLKDVARALGSKTYARLRVGIDPPPGPVAGKDWVLGQFTPEQRGDIDASLPKAAACCLAWVQDGLTKAMNEFNA